jgi:hypothetical protein
MCRLLTIIQKMAYHRSLNLAFAPTSVEAVAE